MEHKCLSVCDLLFQILSLVILNPDFRWISIQRSRAQHEKLPGFAEGMIGCATANLHSSESSEQQCDVPRQ